MGPRDPHHDRQSGDAGDRLSGRSLASDAHLVAAFRQGLNETGYVDGQTVATYDLYPTADVPAAGFFGRAWDSLRLLFH